MRGWEAWDLSLAALSLRQGVVSSLGRSGCGRSTFLERRNGYGSIQEQSPGVARRQKPDLNPIPFKVSSVPPPTVFRTPRRFCPSSFVEGSEQPTEERRRRSAYPVANARSGRRRSAQPGTGAPRPTPFRGYRHDEIQRGAEGGGSCCCRLDGLSADGERLHGHHPATIVRAIRSVAQPG